MIEQNLRTYLLGQPAITALISSRMYPLQLPQGATLPAITYQRIAGTSHPTHDGTAPIGDGRFQLDCWGNDAEEMQDLAEAVRAATDGKTIPMGDDPHVGSRLVTIVDLPEPDVTLWRRMVEIRLMHQQ